MYPHDEDQRLRWKAEEGYENQIHLICKKNGKVKVHTQMTFLKSKVIFTFFAVRRWDKNF